MYTPKEPSIGKKSGMRENVKHFNLRERDKNTKSVGWRLSWVEKSMVGIFMRLPTPPRRDVK